jgi:hypothetical protein
MLMEELMLVNPESTGCKRRRKQKTLVDHLPEAGPQVKNESRIHRQGQDKKQSTCG